MRCGEWRKKNSVNAKRRWDYERAQGLRRDLRHAPKLFWKMFGNEGPREHAFGVEEWTESFSRLFDIGDGGSSACLYDGQGGRHQDVEDLFPVPGETQKASAASLNEPITRVEVLKALSCATNGKAQGADGIPMEFIKCATVEVRVGNARAKQNVLLDHIVHLFNNVLCGDFPTSWAVGIVSPVPKPKGNVGDMDDYRGIVVGNAIAKLYSMVLMHRLDSWAEKEGVRAAGQSGFRQGRGTTDASFVLQHVIGECREEGKPVYAAFIDFKKAYDSVRRPLLWDCLRSLGIHGSFLDSVIGMYRHVQLQVRQGGEVGQQFPSHTGLKQGDPLSPLLFGLFIDRIEAFLAKRLPDVGLKVMQTVVRVLLYADDLVLLAASPNELQKMLDVLDVFCKVNSLTVNQKKSEVVVFNKCFCTMRGKISVTYDKVELAFREEFIYLGTSFCSKGGSAGAGVRCLDKGRRAMYALIRRCNTVDIQNVYLRCRLFDSLVKPVLLFGDVIWGPSALSQCLLCKHGTGLLHDAELMHRGFLRKCLHVNNSVHVASMMIELKRHPLWLDVLMHVVRFWNNVQKRLPSDLVKMAMNEGFDRLERGYPCSGWVRDLSKCLAVLDVPLVFGGQIDELMVYERAYEVWLSRHGTAQSDVRVRDIPDSDRRHFRFITYMSWFASDGNIIDRFWYQLDRVDLIQSIARYRFGCHGLNIDRQRQNGVPRSMRACRMCALDDREDEAHILICPAYEDIRQRFGVACDVGSVDVETLVRKYMASPSSGDSSAYWRNIGLFIQSVLRHRNNSLS